MTEAAQPAATGEEPSIEEILASIRKIISDDPEAEAQATTDTAGDAAMPLPPEEPAPPHEPEEEALDLSAFAEDTAMPSDTIEETFAVPNEPKVESPLVEDANFDLGLEDTPEIEDIANIDISEIMANSSFSSAPASESLVSDAAADAAAAAMAKLAHAADPAPGQTQLWVGTRTIEQLVEDLLRPMLKTWLDQNLPRTVERLVEKELARMARKASE